MNGQRTLRISTVPEAQNHPTQGLLFLPFFSYVLNKYQRGYSFRTYKKKGKIAALVWNYFVLQEQLKSLMYIDRSLRSDPKKYKSIDELNFKHFRAFK